MDIETIISVTYEMEGDGLPQLLAFQRVEGAPPPPPHCHVALARPAPLAQARAPPPLPFRDLFVTTCLNLARVDPSYASSPLRRGISQQR
jgi:hypothetical protein